MASPIIDEFIQALDEEIEALTRGKGGSVVKVFNGRFMREIGGLFVYLFNLDNFLTALEDTPANIVIENIAYPAYILSTKGLEVEIGIESDCGQYIAEANLITDLWYLLEILKKKFAESKSGSANMDFHLSDILFSGKTVKFQQTGEININYSPSKAPPNENQRRAIESSFSSQMSVIWGPPGTGKTNIIAKAIEAHLNAGRRVLLVSHANNAVDEALEDVAEQLKITSLYQEGKLVRLGKPKEEHLRRLEKDYELVLLDKIAAKLGESLLQEKRELQDELGKLENEIPLLRNAAENLQDFKKLSRELEELENNVAQSEGLFTRMQDELKNLKAFQAELLEKLVKAKSAGPFGRFFKGLNPSKIQENIDRTSISISSKSRIYAEMKSRLEELKDILQKKKAELRTRKKELQKVLKSLGVSEEAIESELKEFEERKDAILSRIAEIDKFLQEIESKILSEAMLIATTLTKTFSSKQFPNSPFDVLILDEASMAPLPHLYWALGRSRKYVTIVGDFLQLPPICISKKPMAVKWLDKSIFNVMGIDSIDKAPADNRVNFLDIQYRMPPEVSYISNHFFYKGLLKDAPDTKNRSTKTPGSNSPLVLVKTDAMNPWCSRIPGGGRFNLNHALVTASISKQIIQTMPDAEVGIITPYVAQARLINRIARDWGLLEKLHISTVHGFQGGQADIVIFDSVEGLGTRVPPMLDDTKPDSDARLVLNVAFTRSKNQLYMVAHTNHLRNTLSDTSVLARIVNHMRLKAEIMKAEDFVDDYYATDFEKYADVLLKSLERNEPVAPGKLFTERNFWAQFLEDIRAAKSRLIILSPFISAYRAGRLMDYFQAMRGRNIEVRVYTRPSNQQIGELASQSQDVLKKFRELGIVVAERANMHQKIAILDNNIAWEGSLNILSHRDSQEQMRRFVGPSAIEDIIKNLELDKADAAGNISDTKCPKCGVPMVFRKSKYGRFLSCSKYPKCDGKLNANR